jgi:IS5 family transposase
MWKNSPEWQYFCGEEFFSESYPLHNASLQIWSRTVGEKGRTFMTNALVNGFIQEKRLTKPDNTKENLKTYFRSFPAQQEHRESSNISAI